MDEIIRAPIFVEKKKNSSTALFTELMSFKLCNRSNATGVAVVNVLYQVQGRHYIPNNILVCT